MTHLDWDKLDITQLR